MQFLHSVGPNLLIYRPIAIGILCAAYKDEKGTTTMITFVAMLVPFVIVGCLAYGVALISGGLR